MALRVGDRVLRWSGLEGVVIATRPNGEGLVRYDATSDGVLEVWADPNDEGEDYAVISRDAGR